jgi:endonuclease/exonuclease/phosphatase (EEP) superfamily protein YafD
MLAWILGFSFGVFVFLTLLPLSRKTVWWVRGADFPRLQLVAVGVVLLVLDLVLLDRGEPATWAMAGITLACVIYQAWWILPYTRLFPNEVKMASSPERSERLRVMSANILMTNHRVGDFLRIVRRERPDVLVTLETNAWWERELASLEKEYPHRLSCPLENLYGMHLYSRFPLEDAKLQFLVEPEVPSMHTLFVLPSGRRVRLHCLHPAPPSPTENPTSKERDAELVMVGRSVKDAKYPVIVSGDLNDVAWSATTRLFRKLSGLLDPRIGRGMYNTFHARYPFCRWPVDHFFHSEHFTLVHLARMEACGSDHFPVLVELALEPEAPRKQEGLPADAEDLAEAREKMREENVSSADVHRPGESR